MSKRMIYLMGLITLLAFPALGLVTLWFFNGINPQEVLAFDQIPKWQSFAGLAWGILFALFSLFLFSKPFFDQELSRQRFILSSMNLNVFDKVFLSFCAGFGEEILFRAGLQHYVGVWITTLFFIAIHGYLNPKKWKMSLYGIFLIPFIASLAYAYGQLGIWFCIAAHFSYDLVLFMNIEPLPENFNQRNYPEEEEEDDSEEE